MHAERRLLHAVFQQVPVPVFLLGQDTSIRRVNAAAADLLGSGPGYATGKQFAALVDLPDRARLQDQLARGLRGEEPPALICRLLSADGLVDSELTVRLAGLRGDSDQLIVAVTSAGTAPRGDRHAIRRAARGADEAGLQVVRQLTRRLDLAAAVTRLLLENITLSESATLQRCARLLASELASWVIIDVERSGALRRQFVTGPDEPQAADLAAVVGDIDPSPGSAPRLVHESASSLLLTHAEDTGSLGAGPDGMPVVLLLNAASVLCVPLSDGERSYGSVTLLRQGREGHFGLADVAVAEEIGEQLALAIRADRMFRRRSAVAEALQATLLPRELPRIPGIEMAMAHVGAFDGADLGGDFYDAFPVPGGWGIAIGEVCGPSRNVVAVVSAARHAIRVIARAEPDPPAILRGANDVLLGEHLAGEFVTAHAALLCWQNERLHLVLGSAGQPAPVLVTASGQARQLRGGGQPLGIFTDAEPSVQALDLSPGDVLFFFTDGVTHARSLEMGYFGDRLTDELAALAGKPAADIVAGLQQRVLRFCDGQVRDDITMLALRVAAPPD